MKPDTGRESRVLPTPPAFSAPVGRGGPRWFIAMTLGIEKLGWCGYSTVKIFEDVFIPVNKM